MALVCLVTVQPIDPNTLARVTLRACNTNDRRVTGLGGDVWEPALSSDTVLGSSIWNGDFTDAVDPATATITLSMTTLTKTYPAASSAIYMGAPVEIFAETAGTAWPWTRRFKGRVKSYSRAKQSFTITAEIDQEPFSAKVLSATYAGTGGIEGGGDIKGKVKPLAIGWPKNVEPVLINAVDSVYQFSAYGAIEAVTALYERGSSFGAATADYADYAALVAATIAPGKWATCLAQGLVRLGAPIFMLLALIMMAGVKRGEARTKVEAGQPA